jgi:hypothetical protein
MRMQCILVKIRQASASDENAIQRCAEQAYGPDVALIGRKPAPMMADYGAQIASGHVHVASGPDGNFKGFIVFVPEGEGMPLTHRIRRTAG